MRYSIINPSFCLLLCAAAPAQDAKDVTDTFYSLSEDGTELRRLFTVPGTSFGAPAVSPDGKTLAFSGWQADLPSNMSRIFIVALDQSSFSELCTGAMPTWSPDGRYLAMSRSEVDPNGVWIAAADGSQFAHVAAGWAGRWSPNGKTIAYTRGSRLTLYDVETAKLRDLFTSSRHPYQSVIRKFAFSPDSQRICFAGRNPDNSLDIAIVGVNDPEAKPKVIAEGAPVYPGFAWHPHGHRICCTMPHPEHGRFQMYEFDPDSDEPPSLVAGQDPEKHNRDPCWTPDGTQLIHVAVE
ncbi:MAG: hypothetical protein DWQ29_00545 [Planctomycetota bacterium]|nr:MAG: hypothetical protein DWQ29_00545 [Planctomycetota bacterium]